MWREPSDATNAELTAVASFLSEHVTIAGPNDTTTISEFQGMCAEAFSQPFKGKKWNRWFDKQVDKLDGGGDIDSPINNAPSTAAYGHAAPAAPTATYPPVVCCGLLT